MPKRLFIAINLPMELKRELFEIQKEINAPFPEELTEAGLFKWVAMENLHLTLKFIGEVGGNQIPKIIENIESIVKNQKPFEIKTKRICYDNEKQLPRLIWLTTNNGHITLARIKQWVFKTIEPEERPNISCDFEVKFPVNSIELMQSILKRTGPEYKIIKSFSLNNPPASG